MPNEYSSTLYVRTVNPGTLDEFMIFGSDPSDVDDTVVGPGDSVSPTVARYMLVGTGEIHHTAPLYVETAGA